jgi:hypothetical protein
VLAIRLELVDPGVRKPLLVHGDVAHFEPELVADDDMMAHEA